MYNIQNNNVILYNQEIPKEIFIQLIDESTAADLCHRIGLVSKSWQSLSQDNSLWEKLFKADFASRITQTIMDSMKTDSWKNMYKTYTVLIAVAKKMQWGSLLGPVTRTCRNSLISYHNFDDNNGDQGMTY